MDRNETDPRVLIALLTYAAQEANRINMRAAGEYIEKGRMLLMARQQAIEVAMNGQQDESLQNGKAPH